MLATPIRSYVSIPGKNPG